MRETPTGSLHLRVVKAPGVAPSTPGVTTNCVFTDTRWTPATVDPGPGVRKPARGSPREAGFLRQRRPKCLSIRRRSDQLRQACTAPPIAKPAITTPQIRSKTSIKLVVSCGIALSSQVCQLPESRLIHKARWPFAVSLRESSASFLTKLRCMSRSIWSGSALTHSRLDMRNSTAKSPLRKCFLAH